MATTEVTAPNGLKYDAGKPPMTLLDRYALEQTALVLAYGAQKYARHNWRKGIEVSRLLDAAVRHIYASDEEHLDAESGLPHLAHAMCCIMFALRMTKDRPDMDDRLLHLFAEPEPLPRAEDHDIGLPTEHLLAALDDVRTQDAPTTPTPEVTTEPEPFRPTVPLAGQPVGDWHNAALAYVAAVNTGKPNA